MEYAPDIIFFLIYAGALAYVVFQGRFLRSSMRYLAITLMLFMVIGGIFKLQHWPYGSLIIKVSSISLYATYIFWFLKKQRRQLLDWIKVIWVLSLLLYTLIEQITPVINQALGTLSILMFISMVVVTIMDQRERVKKK